MFYNVLKAKELANLRERNTDKNILLESNTGSLSIVALKKDEIIENHISEEDAAVYVIKGEIEIHFTAEKFKLGKGEILMFKKGEEHKVLALKDSKFFVIRI